MCFVLLLTQSCSRFLVSVRCHRMWGGWLQGSCSRILSDTQNKTNETSINRGAQSRWMSAYKAFWTLKEGLYKVEARIGGEDEGLDFCS
ncbi:hypothetical protein F5J12DRAFT_866875 [Pisolithus orientalis]|uniref:uncharacterized protein n=1 Tax=Pisolithus orientalis TaxID=936130 RepID=UPI002224122D|nr:uncharacterized protein F5J12DRAFT_866875 [Pisolithus orientalis]KAI5987399.1 hypothetical protein F5J12DRAFT_866875 [Pisolithus orientalis]